MYSFQLTQAKERESRELFTLLLLSLRESLPRDIVTSTSLSDRDTSEESLRLSSMTQEEDLPSSRSTSETPINTRKTPSTSSQLREPTPVNTSSAVARPKLPLETSSP
jgi:hypothetical protein